MPQSNQPRPLDAAGLAGAVICCILWGGNAVAVKYAISPEALPPVGAAALRFALSLPVVAWVCARSAAGFRVARRHWWLLGVHGTITAVQIATFNWGTSFSEAGRSSVFINIHPLVVAPLAWLLLHEHLGRRGVLGLASAAAGVTVILAKQIWQGGGLAGDVVVLASGVVFGVQTIAQKLTFPTIPARTLLFYQTALALPMTLAWSLAVEGTSSYHFTTADVWGVLYQGVAVSGVCFSLWLILLGRYSASRLATVAFLTPLFGISFGALLRGEPLTWPLMAGAGLVGLGIWLVATGKAAAAEPAPIPADAPAAVSTT